MKMYVLGYRSKEEDGGRGRKVSLPHEVEVQYTKVPEWKLPFRELAEIERDNLQRMHVHVGLHYCEFSVEGLPNNEFGIVCLSHT